MAFKKIVEIDKLQEVIKDSSNIYIRAVEIIGTPDRFNDFENYINYLFLIRFGYNFKAISKLLQFLNESSYFKIPIFLILRTCVSDLLTLYYFIYISGKDDNDSKIKSKIYGFLVDHLYRADKELIGMLEKSEITDKEYNNYKQYLNQNFHDFFNDKGKLISREFVSFQNIYDQLKVNPKLSWISKAYEYYKYMSKFEHVGAFTNEMQEFHKLYYWYDRNGILITYSLLNDGLYYIVKSLKNEELNEMLKKLNKKIVDNFY